MATLMDLITHLSGFNYNYAAKRDGGEYAGPCPFCGTGEDRFRIWPYGAKPTYWCRKCDKRGGPVQFLIEFKYITGKEAVEFLKEFGVSTDFLHSTPKRVIPPPSIKDLKITLSESEVYDWHKSGRLEAYKYFSLWGLTLDDIDNYWLGANEDGYTIPHWWTGKEGSFLKGLKIRRRTNEHKLRFTCYPSSITRGIFNDQFTSNPDGTRDGPFLSELYILESEKDAMLLSGRGFPAIAFFPEKSWLEYANVIFKNIIQPVFIYDADGGKGLDRALDISQHIRQACKFESTEALGVKSPSDVYFYLGANALDNWLKELRDV